MTALDAGPAMSPPVRRNGVGRDDAAESMLRAAHLKKYFPLKGSLFGRT